jgi:hypothetical protein
MRKTLVPMVACLALSATATAALIVNAQAEQAVRRPVMVAQAPRNAPPPGMDGGREPSCSDIYTDRADEMAYLESRLSLTGNQAPLFARWKQVALDIARRNQADCTAYQRNANRSPTLLEGLADEETMLKSRLSDLQQERPVLEAFYRSLSPSQRDQFERQDSGPPQR